MILNKSKVVTILGFLSIFPVIVSIIVFLNLRGPNSDIYFIITIFSILSIIGIILAVISSVMSKRRITGLIGLIGLIANLIVLACAFLLLLAMGISEA